MFSNLGSYKDHKRKIHVEKQKPYQCNRCHKQFSKEEALKIHQQIIHKSPLINSALEKKRFPCSICERKFSSQQYLKKHISSHVISSISVWKNILKKEIPPSQIASSKDSWKAFYSLPRIDSKPRFEMFSLFNWWAKIFSQTGILEKKIEIYLFKKWICYI